MSLMIQRLALFLGVSLAAFGGTKLADLGLHQTRQAYSYDLDALHQWACDYAISKIGTDDKIGGCYDLCDAIAVHATKWAIQDCTTDSSCQFFDEANEDPKLKIPVFIDQHDNGEGDPELIDACAIVMNGAEW